MLWQFLPNLCLWSSIVRSMRCSLARLISWDATNESLALNQPITRCSRSGDFRRVFEEVGEERRRMEEGKGKRNNKCILVYIQGLKCLTLVVPIECFFRGYGAGMAFSFPISFLVLAKFSTEISGGICGDWIFHGKFLSFDLFTIM